MATWNHRLLPTALLKMGSLENKALGPQGAYKFLELSNENRNKQSLFCTILECMNFSYLSWNNISHPQHGSHFSYHSNCRRYTVLWPVPRSKNHHVNDRCVSWLVTNTSFFQIMLGTGQCRLPSRAQTTNSAAGLAPCLPVIKPMWYLTKMHNQM